MPPSSDSSPVGPPSSAQSEAEWERLFDLSGDLLCVAGLDGYLKRVNPSWTRVLGWSRAELLSRPVEDFMHPDDREFTLRARDGLKAGAPVRGLENRYLCKGGGYRWLSWHSTVEPGSARVFCVARDITERRRQDMELFMLGKMESAGLLAGGIAHDFNNLLTGLQLNLEIIGLSGPVTPAQRAHLGLAHESIRAAAALTRQLMTVARGGEVSRTTTDLGPLLRQSMDIALAGAAVRGRLDLGPGLWRAEVDESQIGQVVRNLLQNAREALPAGGEVRLRAENVTLGPAQEAGVAAGEYVLIQVCDEGPGIAPEVLPNVFDPYFSTKERGSQKGMGLGLSICHAILQKNSGSISIESQPGRGTTVRCHLPAAREKGPAAEAVRPEEEAG